MSGVFGVVTEFNPFHNGHAALAATARERGADSVVAVMSGNFVQRGTPAVTDKRVRARAALLCGFDLIIELPLPFATAPARRFARGAIELLAATGAVDSLIFGCESGGAEKLRALAAAEGDPRIQPVLRELLAEGMTYARARQQAVASILGGEAAAALAGPNNALAVEYLRAASEIGWNPEIAAVKRLGTAHDSEAPGVHGGVEFASASLLRRDSSSFETLARYAPPEAVQVYAEAFAAGLYPADPARLEAAMLTHLRRLSPDALALLPDLSEGLENRLYAAIRKSATLAELEASLKTKRYTMARVRRLILAAFLGLTREDASMPAPYIRVIGCSPSGREILSAMKKTCRLPVSHSLARLRAMGGACERFAALEELATDLYALALPFPPACGYEYTARPFFF